MWHNICVFAQEDAKGNDSLMEVCFNGTVFNAHINDQSVRDYHIEIDKRATIINFLEEAALAWSFRSPIIVLGGLKLQIGGLKPT